MAHAGNRPAAESGVQLHFPRAARMGVNPHVNCGRGLKALDLPDLAQYA
jgi:phosphoketolase